MHVNFDELPEHSRIWVYQSDRELTSDQQQLILQIGKEFIEQWVSHGEPLTASMAILNGYFVVVAVDDRNLPSGCSIDASVGLIRNLSGRLGIDFFNRTRIPLWTGEEVHMVPLEKLKTQIKNGEISYHSRLVNTLVQKKSELSDWIITVGDSWLSRYLPQPQDNIG